MISSFAEKWDAVCVDDVGYLRVDDGDGKSGMRGEHWEEIARLSRLEKVNARKGSGSAVSAGSKSVMLPIWVARRVHLRRSCCSSLLLHVESYLHSALHTL